MVNLTSRMFKWYDSYFESAALNLYWYLNSEREQPLRVENFQTLLYHCYFPKRYSPNLPRRFSLPIISISSRHLQIIRSSDIYVKAYYATFLSTSLQSTQKYSNNWMKCLHRGCCLQYLTTEIQLLIYLTAEM